MPDRRTSRPISIKVCLATASIFMVGALAACEASSSRPSAAHVAPVKVRINDKQIAAQAYLYLALDQGYFQAEQLDVELVRTDGGSDVTVALAANNIEFADTAPTAPLFNAIARGVRVKALMSSGITRSGDRSNGLLVRQDLIDSGRYRGPADLKGMKIAVQTPGGSTWYVAQRALASGNLSAADVEFVILPFPDALAALAGKTVDAAFELEPFITSARERGIATLAIPSADVVPDLQGPLLIVGETYAQNHPDVVTRFLTAAVRGLRDYDRLTHASDAPDAVFVSSLVRHTPMRDPVAISRLAVSLVDPNGAINTRSVEQLQHFFVESGQQQREIDLSEIVDSQYLDEVLARLGRMS